MPLCAIERAPILVFLDDLDLQARLAGIIQRRYGMAASPMIINGRVDGAARQARVDRFQVGPDEFDAMILSPRAGGVGLTLIGQLLQSGPLDLREVPCSCNARQKRDNTCNHQRKCGILTLSGKNIGDTLIAEELAVPFRCTKLKCQKMPDWPTIIKQMENH
jgi:hypothetical protein